MTNIANSKKQVFAIASLFFVLLLYPAEITAQSLEDAKKLNRQVIELYKMGQYREAIQLSNKSLEIREKTLGPEHPDVAQSLSNLALLNLALGEYGKAEPLLKRALAIFEKSLGTDHPEVATGLNNLAGLYNALGDYGKVEALLKRALEIQEKVLSPDHQIVGTSLNNLAMLYKALGEYGKAEPLLKRALAIFEKSLGPDHAEVAQILNNLAALYQALGDFGKAKPLYQRSLEIREKVLSPNHPNTAESLDTLAMMYEALGEYGKAEPLLKRALAIFEKSLGPDHPKVATTLCSLATLYVNSGEYIKAEQLYKRTLAIREKVFSPDHPSMATSLNNQALLYLALGDYGKAEPLLKRALAIFEKSLGPDHAEVAQILNNLAALYQALGDYGKAEPFCKRSLAILENVLGPDHPHVVASLDNLAFLYLASGRVEEAYSHCKKKGIPACIGACHLARKDFGEAAVQYERAVKADEQSREKELVVENRIGLGLSYEGKKDHHKAIIHYRKAVDLIELQREALEQAAKERFISGRTGGNFFRIQAYEGLARCLHKLGDYENGFKASESTKARVLSESIARRVDATILRVPENILSREADLTNRIAGYHNMLEKLYQNKQLDRHKEVEKELETLREEQKAFITQLRKDYPGYAAVKYPIPLSASEVRLKAGEVLLSYQVTDQGVISYLVRDGKVVSSDWIELERKQLEELVKSYRAGFEGVEYVSDLKKYDPKLSPRLYELVLAKHLSQVKKQEKLIIVPDGVLALLPFEALVMDENPLTYVGDNYDIVYAHSGTSLALGRTLRKERKAVSKNLLVLADPVFDKADARISGKVQVAKKDESQTDKEKAIAKASMGAGKAEVFPRLVITGKGAERLGVLFKGSVDSLTGLDARKEVFLQKPLDQYKYLALLTHGILDNELPYVREPALVLTQVNTKDGFLTMTEVMGLNLHCEVAALTACSTGIGRRVSGEGVMHMGRGFQYAGARSVLMSLWNIAEDSTTYMAERFFTYLKEGQDPRTSLRQARQDLRNQSGGKYDHPYFWAPFILMGE